MNDMENKVQSLEPDVLQEPVMQSVPLKQPTESDDIKQEVFTTPAPAFPSIPPQENVLMGVVGAFLLALVGGLLYFIIYQFGFIAGICGLITVVLASFGYQKFSGVRNSLKGTIFAVIISVIVLFLGEYFGLSYEIYNIYKADYGISFFDAVRSTPSFLTEPEILSAVVKDLLIAYLLGGVASFSTIRQAIHANKKTEGPTPPPAEQP